MTLQRKQHEGHAIIDESFQAMTERIREAVEARGKRPLTSLDVVLLREEVRTILESEQIQLALKLSALADETKAHGFNQ